MGGITKAAVLSVSDNGVGIPQQDLSKVLEPFFSSKTNGTGLGLAIVRKILEDHQTKLLIASKEGQGTTVTIKFPVGDRVIEQTKVIVSTNEHLRDKLSIC